MPDYESASDYAFLTYVAVRKPDAEERARETPNATAASKARDEGAP